MNKTDVSAERHCKLSGNEDTPQPKRMRSVQSSKCGHDEDGGKDSLRTTSATSALHVNNHNVLAVMYGWLRHPGMAQARQMLAKSLGLDSSATINSSPADRVLEVEWAGSGILLMRMSMPGFDVEQKDEAYLCSYIRSIQRIIALKLSSAQGIDSDIANTTLNKPGNIELFLGHGGACVSKQSMIYDDACSDMRQHIFSLATIFEGKLVFTRRDWQHEVEMVVERCLRDWSYSRKKVIVNKVACTHATRCAIPSQLNMFGDVDELEVNVRADSSIVYLPNLARMNPKRITLSSNLTINTYAVDWTGMTNLDTVTCSFARVVEWPGSLPSLRHLKVDKTPNFDFIVCCAWTNLQTIIISSCTSIHQIPSQVSNLTNLSHLKLEYLHNLESIDSLRTCTKLQHLHLSFCFKLAGRLELPPSMRTLYMRYCKFSRCMIPSIVACRNLTQLYMEDMNFNVNKLPQEIFSLGNLETLALTRCSVRGVISPHFASMTNLKMLYLDDNKLTGSIPDVVLQMPSLQELDVSLNRRLHGAIVCPENLDMNVEYTNIVLSERCLT